jgi:hypothetical protein
MLEKILAFLLFLIIMIIGLVLTTFLVIAPIKLYDNYQTPTFENDTTREKSEKQLYIYEGVIFDSTATQTLYITSNYDNNKILSNAWSHSFKSTTIDADFDNCDTVSFAFFKKDLKNNRYVYSFKDSLLSTKDSLFLLKYKEENTLKFPQ